MDQQPVDTTSMPVVNDPGCIARWAERVCGHGYAESANREAARYGNGAWAWAYSACSTWLLLRLSEREVPRGPRA